MKKHLFISVLVAVVTFLSGCTSQQFVDEAFVDDAPNFLDDEFASLIEQARWGDGQAFLKLADCYRDGKGVEKELMGMFGMIFQAAEFGGINRAEDYLMEVPEGSDFRLIAEAIGKFENGKKEEAQSLCEQLIENGNADGYTVQGIIAKESGDTIGALHLIGLAASKGSSIAKVLSCAPEWRGSNTFDLDKLKALSDEVPFVNSILAEAYTGMEDASLRDDNLAIYYFMKADEKAFLDKRGARWLLNYHRNVSSLPLSGRDIQRIHILAREESETVTD